MSTLTPSWRPFVVAMHLSVSCSFTRVRATPLQAGVCVQVVSVRRHSGAQLLTTAQRAPWLAMRFMSSQ